MSSVDRQYAETFRIIKIDGEWHRHCKVNVKASVKNDFTYKFKHKAVELVIFSQLIDSFNTKKKKTLCWNASLKRQIFYSYDIPLNIILLNTLFNIPFHTSLTTKQLNLPNKIFRWLICSFERRKRGKRRKRVFGLARLHADSSLKMRR